ncbi:hypothetical protein ARAM_004611 [Aspergillus rambellii]|uniref:EthD domain-containing protein n=2 Tax=Aspergillus subgen. Nidulantes TaxID=2720870 RepID=A0A0F8U8F1_9EURO|nr:hypothetical protein AOCH_002313 [Aspergillus ochraceoroseus]KKK16034.1 hypothetical protein ARAM_004611 [Aspergillus rambellii]
MQNLYPREAEFNGNYYVNTHMALAAELLGPSVLVSWELYRLPDDAPFSYEIAVTWASAEARQRALESDAGQTLARDVVNFSRMPPIVMLRRPLACGGP